MERKLVEVGHRVEAHPKCGLIPDITHALPGRGGERLRPRWGNGIHDRMIEVIIAYARREPVRALTSANCVGFLVGLGLAMGSRATTGAKSFLGRRTRSGRRRLLQLE
jgi:hypothetical protein